MARKIFQVMGWTPVGVANTTAFTDAGHMSIKGGSSTQLTYIKEVKVDGQATSNAVTPLLLAHDSTVGATLTALSNSSGETDAWLDPASADLAAPALPFTSSTTKPQRSASLHLGSLSLNAWGGNAFWEPPEGKGPGILGNTASLGEISLSCYTGGSPGAVSAHIIYETM